MGIASRDAERRCVTERFETSRRISKLPVTLLQTDLTVKAHYSCQTRDQIRPENIRRVGLILRLGGRGWTPLESNLSRTALRRVSRTRLEPPTPFAPGPGGVVDNGSLGEYVPG